MNGINPDFLGLLQDFPMLCVKIELQKKSLKLGLIVKYNW